MILKCDCVSDFQDRHYGKGMRVHNVLKKANEFRCTVCQKIKAK